MKVMLVGLDYFTTFAMGVEGGGGGAESSITDYRIFCLFGEEFESDILTLWFKLGGRFCPPPVANWE